jgi:hypothetical protein
MFYDGDLQGGINKALQENKLVACFVRGKILMMEGVNLVKPCC